MTDFFTFDEKYKVDKKISPAKFLESANLIPSEKEKLEKSILDVTILYDLPSNYREELFIIGVQVGNFISYGIKTNDIAVAVAKSIPYPSIIVLFIGENAQIFLFETRANKQNNFRSFIESSKTSKIFSSGNPEPYIISFLWDINSVQVPLLTPPNDVIKGLMNMLDVQTQHDSLLSELKKEQIKRKQEIFKLIDEPDDFEIDWEESFEGLYVNCLAGYALSLYQEQLEKLNEIQTDENGEEYLMDEEDKDEWIFYYIEYCCDEMIQNEFSRNITNSEIKRILTVFFNEEIIETDSDVLDIDTVRSFIAY